jgi:hypothetical protein
MLLKTTQAFTRKHFINKAAACPNRFNRAFSSTPINIVEWKQDFAAQAKS